MENLKKSSASSLDAAAIAPEKNCSRKLNVAEHNSDKEKINPQTVQTTAPAGKKSRLRKGARARKAAEDVTSKEEKAEGAQSAATKAQSAKRPAEDAADHAHPQKKGTIFVKGEPAW